MGSRGNSVSKIWWDKPFELDRDQKAVLALPLEGKHLVSGPPGSGKSNLLVLRAKNLVLDGTENFKILAFSQPLVRFLQSSKKVPKDKIVTAMKWLEGQLWDLEGKRINEKDFIKKRQALCAALSEHLRHNKKQGLVHTLLIDEIQDYNQAEVALFEEFAENLFLVGDIRQQIFESDATQKYMDELTKRGFDIVELQKHYRIGRKICAFADRLAKPAKGHKPISAGAQYDEDKNPSLVERVQLTFADQIETIASRCKTQIETFPGEFIGVLCPTNPILNAVALELAKKLPDLVTVQRKGEYEDFDDSRPVILSTVHGGKGLEYRCVHFPAGEELKHVPRSREVVYTAVTRARTTVSIYHNAGLNDFLEDALRADAPPKTAASIEDLFE